MDKLDNSEFEDLQKKLKDLNCPFIYEVDSMGIQEMFFKPGESRMKIFEWLLMSFNGNGFSKFQSLNKNNNKTSISQYFAKVLTDLGYCKEEVLSVIQGTASVKLQATCFKSVLDAIIYNRDTSSSLTFLSNDTCIDINSFSQSTATIVNSTFNNSEGIKRSSFQYSAFLDTILENEILPNFIEEVPLDIQNLLEKLVCTKKGSKANASLQTYVKFDAMIKNHETVIEDLNTQIEAMNFALKAIPLTTYPSEETNIKFRETCNKLSRNSSLYSIIHANEIRPSCNPQKVDLSELGPACFSLSKAIERLNNIKQTISQFKMFFEVIQKQRHSIKKLSENRGSYRNPDGWIHDSRIFRTEFIKTLKPLVSSLNCQYSMDTFCNETALN